ncbi:hypothetical protein K490DRAFT_65903 [Saccharata proteae CBS 121410]|uniref:Uncharacterized protein n=1 Tax=Saccharata proteae CBS 121410 TaxID=1314787 RepID=A0A9P4HXH0_9PEZI|nr:hypothetical protein K490DRAFT_65903 [Saccharata proteae CBS 121410]
MIRTRSYRAREEPATFTYAICVYRLGLGIGYVLPHHEFVNAVQGIDILDYKALSEAMDNLFPQPPAGNIARPFSKPRLPLPFQICQNAEHKRTAIQERIRAGLDIMRQEGQTHEMELESILAGRGIQAPSGSFPSGSSGPGQAHTATGGPTRIKALMDAMRSEGEKHEAGLRARLESRGIEVPATPDASEGSGRAEG